MLSLLATAALATSVYTNLDLRRCIRLELVEEGESAVWKCPGLQEVGLYVESGDGRYDIDAGVQDKDELWSGSFDDIPPTVEWRMKRGRPYAIIYRLTLFLPDRTSVSRLIVETLGRPHFPGCRIADIAGSLPAANELARRAADKILTKTATCLAARPKDRG